MLSKVSQKQPEAQSRPPRLFHLKSDVVLPQWAKNDPVRFASINRKALESETTSAHLHKWIDLIFSVFQNDCKNKMNSFHPLTYEGEINVGCIDRRTDEFGNAD